MRCYNCESQLMWGGDTEDDAPDTEHTTVTNLTCSECNAFVLVYWGEKEEKA
jgi:formate dehydrogenase maturation protein FdhE